MTAGLRCCDGLILFADTELTYPESLKYYSSAKVYVYEDLKGTAVALSPQNPKPGFDLFAGVRTPD